MSISKFAAGIVIVHESDLGPRFLLLRAYRNWDLPKGLVEQGEQPFAAAWDEAVADSRLMVPRGPAGAPARCPLCGGAPRWALRWEG